MGNLRKWKGTPAKLMSLLCICFWLLSTWLTMAVSRDASCAENGGSHVEESRQIEEFREKLDEIEWRGGGHTKSPSQRADAAHRDPNDYLDYLRRVERLCIELALLQEKGMLTSRAANAIRRNTFRKLVGIIPPLRADSNRTEENARVIAGMQLIFWEHKCEIDRQVTDKERVTWRMHPKAVWTLAEFFEYWEGRPPSEIGELRSAGFVDKLIVDPDGNSYAEYYKATPAEEAKKKTYTMELEHPKYDYRSFKRVGREE